MKSRFLLAALILTAVLALALTNDVAWAGSEDNADTVTIEVLGKLSISDSTGNFNLTFSDFMKGTDSGVQVVNYLVRGNSMTNAPLTGVVSAKVSSKITGVDLQADVGTILNHGGPQNVQLAEQNTGFVVVGTNVVELAKKGVTTGNPGKILNETVPITWKATALEDLAAGSYTTTLTVTLKDS